MAVPDSSLVQFNTASSSFYVDSITDPNGAPADVLDLDLGFVITGRVTMPNWLEGTGKICVYAHEIGGDVNKSIGCDKVEFKRPVPPQEPDNEKKRWKVTVPPNSKVLPDPQPGASQVYELVAVFILDDQLTDIGAFVDMGKYMIN